MVLAEALLRVPDGATADALIEDKLAAGDWSKRDGLGRAFLVSASAWTLGVTARVIHPGETPDGIVESLVKRLGCRRCDSRRARRCGCSARISCLARPSKRRWRARARTREFRYSFDMLGEGARTAADAARYLEAYAGAIAAIGARGGRTRRCRTRPGISVKLSALHPRYEAVSRERVLAELMPQCARSGAQGASATISTSPSMPRKPTGSNFRWR